MGEVWPMRADIVDRGIEHGTAKFIVDGGRCACVKYDDYNRDEIGSRDFFAAREKKEIYTYNTCKTYTYIHIYIYIYIYICICICIYCIYMCIYITVIENTQEDFKL